jgi:hypothetical protein
LKKLLVIALLALLVASVVTAAGCGDSNGGDADKDEPMGTVPMGGEDESAGIVPMGSRDGKAYSVVGTYESNEGTFITLKADYTFETDAWEDMQDGNYIFTQEDENLWVELANLNTGNTALLSVMIGMDEVAAIVDNDTLIQYNKR